MNYRSDIQVIRGIAVILVVLFHLGFNSIKSGFLGVDVFFVISGFLMAVLYNKNDIPSFYLRRVKRLLPAYYATVFATVIFAYLLTTPNETVQVAKQAKYAIAFASNIGFWTQNPYFLNVDFNPLLHLWSLGVEMQFYLIVPLLYWVFSKHKSMLWIVLIISLVSCFVFVGISTKTSFFMLPFRLWEFLIGYGAAYYFTNQGNVKLANYRWLGLIGLIIVCIIPLFSVDGEATNAIDGHPGLFALLVTLATASVLIFGIPSFVEKSIISRVLERIGKYSYSIYLAHFPIIVIYLSKPFSGTNLIIPTFMDGVIIVVLMALASALLYYFFEHKRLKISVTKLIVGSSVSLVFLVMILPIIQNKFYSQEDRLIFGAFSDRSTYRCGKLIRVLKPQTLSCDLTPEVDKPEQRVMLVGNSHSDSIKTSFAKVSEAHRSKLLFMVSNTPLTTSDVSAEKVVEDAISKRVDKLVLHFKSLSIPNETIDEVIERSQKAGIKVYFIEPVPEWEESVPVIMYNAIHEDNYSIEKNNKSDYLNINAPQINFVRAIEKDNFKSFPIVDYFCNPDCKYSSSNGKPLYFDKHHLTITGSEQLKEVFDKILLD